MWLSAWTFSAGYHAKPQLTLSLPSVPISQFTNLVELEHLELADMDVQGMALAVSHTLEPERGTSTRWSFLLT